MGRSWDRARPRLGIYRWYLAQALLLAGDGTRALEELRKSLIDSLGPDADGQTAGGEA